VENVKLVYDYRGKLVPEERYAPPDADKTRRKRIEERRRQFPFGFGSAKDRCLTSDMSEDEDVSASNSDLMMGVNPYAVSDFSGRRSRSITREATRTLENGIPHYAVSPRRYAAYEEERKKLESEEKRRQRVGQHYDLVDKKGRRLVYSLQGSLITEEEFQLQQGITAGSTQTPRTFRRPDSAPAQPQPFRPLALSSSENKGYHGEYDPAIRRTMREPPPSSPRASIDLSWSTDDECVRKDIRAR
jgi:hypothetical protein